MILYQTWYDNGMPYDDHYYGPEDNVYTSYKEAELEILDKGFTNVKKYEDGRIDYYTYNDYDVYEHMYIVEVNLIGEIK